MKRPATAAYPDLNDAAHAPPDPAEALLDLAAKVEALTGPCRETDVLIAQAVWPQLTHYAAHCQGEEPIFWEDPFRKQRCPNFTASLDAAMTLVPEGFDFIIEHVNGGLTICARVGHNDSDRNSWGQTAALALTAAALRARAALSTTARCTDSSAHGGGS